MVVREIPFGTDERNGKKSLYRVADPFLAFWFRFVQPNRSRLESAPMAVTQRKVRDAFSQHTAWVFEALARRSVPHLAIAGQEWGIARRWWGTGSDGQPAELDVVAESSDGERLLVGEVKLSVTDAEIVHLEAKLREKALRLPFSKRYQKLETVVFSAAAGHKKSSPYRNQRRHAPRLGLKARFKFEGRQFRRGELWEPPSSRQKNNGSENEFVSIFRVGLR